MSDRYAYLGCCTQEERENEGTQDEYLELEALREAENLESYILIAASDVSALRKADVYRVLEEVPANNRIDLAKYIAHSRPDLAEEVNEVMRDEFSLVDWDFDIHSLPRDELVADHYDNCKELADSLNRCVVGFEYPDWAHKTVGQALEAIDAQQLEAKNTLNAIAQVKTEVREAGLDVVVDPYDDIADKATAYLGAKGIVGVIRDANKESGSYVGIVAVKNDKFAVIDIGRNHLIVVPNETANGELEAGKKVELKFKGGVAKEVIKSQALGHEQFLERAQ